MCESQLVSEIASKVISDAKFWIVLIGLIGATAGAFITVAGNFILHWLKEKPQKELENKRVAMLKEMLEDDRFLGKWRNLSTLCAVIGASEEETKRLLFIASARGSEKDAGKWGLVKNHPLPDSE